MDQGTLFALRHNSVPGQANIQAPPEIVMSNLRKTLLLLLAALPALACASPIGLATIVAGDTVLTRGSARFVLAEGVAVERGDILETASLTQFVRIELLDGTAIDLGPASRVLLQPSFAGDRRPRPGTLYTLQGWVKLSSPDQPPAGLAGVAAASLDATLVAGNVLVQVDGADVSVFQEIGNGSVAENVRAASARAIKAGQSFTLLKGKLTPLPRVAPEMLANMPIAFRDTLPHRADRFKGQLKEPKPLPAAQYDDLAPWLQSERSLRTALMPRWRQLEKQPEFRRLLIKNLAAHPEWRPILYPPPPPPPPPPAPKPRWPAGPASH